MIKLPFHEHLAERAAMFCTIP